MAVKPKCRTILLPLAESPLDSATHTTCVALSKLSEDQTLIYVGTLAGTLFLYSFRTEISFLKRISVCASPLNSISPLPRIGKVIVFADGVLFLIDATLLESPKRISLIKGVTDFSRKFQTQKNNSRNGHNHNNDFFAIGIGKKLVLAELILSGTLVILKEFQGIFDGIITTLSWIDDSIFVGTKSGYYLYNILNGRCQLIFSLPDASSVPQLRLLANEARVLLMVDNVGIITDMEGNPVGGSLVFKETPDSFAEIGTYVVSARKMKVELYHKKTGFYVQSLDLGDTGACPCVVTDEGAENGKLVAVATKSKVVCYGKISGEKQIKDLLRKKNFKEAISLIDELENEGEMTKDILSFVHAQVGFLLLFDLHFKEAVDHFLLSENMQPSELFPFIMRDPNRWTLLVPRNRYWGLHPPPTPLENVIDNGLTAIQRAVFFKKAGVETSVDDEFLLSPPSRSDLLDSAIENMIRYLRVFHDKDLDLSVKEGVDTLLMYLFRALNRVENMEKLASSENSCVVEELEPLLHESGHLRTLAFLYTGKGMSDKALAIWRILARNYSTSYHKDQYEVTGSLEPLSPEMAAIEASRILEESSDQDLVLQHLGWIADLSQVLAVQILISEKRSNLLLPDKVISAIDPKKVEILRRYLQWLIEDQDSDDSRFHTAYALLLAKSALQSYEMERSSESSVVGMSDDEINISNAGRRTMFESPVRERLQIFLQSSDLYDAEEVLDMIKESDLWLEKAILYRKLGQETLVLQILALKLENCEAAEQYCAEIGRPEAYIQLLEMYLDPKDGRGPMLKAAVHLLHNHGEMLDPMQVLERLSSDIPLQLVSATILRILRARHHHHRQGLIAHSLSHALHVDLSLARLEERSRHVPIDDESVCDSCHARLGTKLFAMYPDDTIVCYKCYRRQGESTSVTNHDFKKDILVKPGWLVTR
ncbi:vacuolar sorting protein 3-like [Primulina eburnea]|uniref:vacuolar sorting protein 3-like n=1 Tax=Primulina eburnea TaxID=1245227 RepID=UPI003C6C3C55